MAYLQFFRGTKCSPLCIAEESDVAAVDRVMMAYGMMVNLTADEQMAPGKR
jgi:hypothetical protein